MMKLPTTHDETRNFELEVRYFVAKHLGKTIIATWMLIGLLWAIFQIPQLGELKREVDSLKTENETQRTFKIIIEKNIARLYDIAKDEREREILREMLRELNQEESKNE